jgi:inorganic triphosphatase YgiF
MGHEIELKLEVAPDAVERLMREPWLNAAECRSKHQVSTYFDTPGGELRSRGYTLRVRSAGDKFVQTVKSLAQGAGLFQRGEWEYEVHGPDPDSDKLQDTPLADVDVARVKPVIRSEVTRTACRLKADGDEVELDFDEGRIVAGELELPVSEVEVELVRGSPMSAVEFARKIAAETPVRLGVLSKAERGFFLADGKLGRIVKAEPVPVDGGMTVAEGFQAIVGACLRHFRLNEPLVIERRFPEALHQARVAMRRLRAAMSLFRTAIADDEFARIRGELRWFTVQLGDARNLDVYLERDLPAAQARTLRENREAAYDHVIEAMDSRRFRTLMLDLVVWSALGEWRERPNAQLLLGPYANRRIDRLWHKVNGVDHLSRMGDEERHHLRILVKKLRYALEFVEALHAHEAARQKKFGRALEDLQDSLGLLNDVVVARTLVTADAWPIVPEERSEEEHKLLHESDHALDRMRKISAYWR